MTGPQIDYAAVFHQLPVPILLLTPELDIVDMNQAYLEVAGRTREDLLGRNVFEAFPDNPSDSENSGPRNLAQSLDRVLATGKSDSLPFVHYDVEIPGRPGVFAKRFWCPVNAPVFGDDGGIVLIAQCVEEISDKVQRFVGGLAADEPQ